MISFIKEINENIDIKSLVYLIIGLLLAATVMTVFITGEIPLLILLMLVVLGSLVAFWQAIVSNKEKTAYWSRRETVEKATKGK